MKKRKAPSERPPRLLRQFGNPEWGVSPSFPHQINKPEFLSPQIYLPPSSEDDDGSFVPPLMSFS